MKIIGENIPIVNIERLVLNPTNPRLHSDDQIDQIIASMTRFGFIVPIVVDSDYRIIAGNARYLAAQKIGLEHVPVILVNWLNENEKRAYAIADNKIALNGAWDEKLLRVELQALVDQGIKLADVGFTQRDFNSLIDELEAQVRRADEDAAPETEKVSVTCAGDLWSLGPHKLLCGDATDAGSFARLLGGEPSHLVFTDPPYNVAYIGPGTGAAVTNDNQGAEFAPFLETVCENLLKHVQGPLYICMSSSELHTLYNAFTNAGGHWSTFIIWAKSTFTLGRSDYHRQYEPILYGWREGKSHYWCGARDESDVWLFDKPHANDLHPTMKPVALVERAILNSSRRGEIVLDPFGGSGSTLIASEKAGRQARLMEIEPSYCDVIIRRWQHFASGQARLEGSDQTFDQVAETRAAGGAEKPTDNADREMS